MKNLLAASLITDKPPGKSSNLLDPPGGLSGSTETFDYVDTGYYEYENLYINKITFF
ncbi:hypothetical protein [Paenibacillus polymyxa]|uniref:hypothetical protein n=1 Tax=Paenibacillus polymyxa TaxID=1406 RepID=UPI002ED47BDD